MNVLYVKSCMERAPRYCQRTMILREGDTRFVRKAPATPAARDHLRSYARNQASLSAALRPGNRVRILPCAENPDGSVDFPFLTDPTLSDLLRGLAPEAYIERVLAFRDALAEAFGLLPFAPGPEFRALFGAQPAVEEAEGLVSLSLTNPDLNFDNLFCAAGEDGGLCYTMIDYEWVMAWPVPLPFVFYRALMLDPVFRGYAPEERRRVMDALGIPPALEEAFAAMEAAFLASISPEETRLDWFARHDTPVTRVNHQLDILLRMPEDVRTLQAALDRSRFNLRRYEGRGWYRALRRGRDRMVSARGRLREAARRRNAFGAFCSFLVSLVRLGPAVTFRKIRHRLHARRAEKAFIRSIALSDAERARQRAESFPEEITFSVLVPLYNTPLPFLEEMIQSVRDQTYPRWQLCLADGSDDAHPEVGERCLRLMREDPRIVYRHLEKNGGISANTNACMDMATGAYFVLFDHDDLLHPAALYENAKAIAEQGADFLYSDEAVFASPNRDQWITTHFKPDFAPENLLSNNYICHLTVFRAALLAEAGRFRPAYDGSQDHDLILRLTGCARKVVHIPKLLYYWRSHAASVAGDIGSKTYAVSAGQRAVRDYLAARGETAFVDSAPFYPTLYHVRFPIPGAPSVRILVHFGPGSDPMAYLKALAATLSYANVAITALVPALPEGAPDQIGPFSVSWVASAAPRAESLAGAAARAGEEVLCFLAPDVLPADRAWLREMLMLALRPGIGAVGARAVFADGTVRHAGLVLGLGRKRLMGRTQFGVPADAGGYFGQLAILEDVSAVSAECMMVRRDRYEEAGGFTAGYRDTLFDADLCLKLLKCGCRNLITPFAQVQGGDPRRFSLDFGVESPAYQQDAETFRGRWADLLAAPDPYYNPNLTLDDADCTLRMRS